MAWAFSFVAKDKKDARKRMDSRFEVQKGMMPKTVSDAVNKMIDTLPDGFNVRVECEGEIDADPGMDTTKRKPQGLSILLVKTTQEAVTPEE